MLKKIQNNIKRGFYDGVSVSKEVKKVRKHKDKKKTKKAKKGNKGRDIEQKDGGHRDRKL